MAEISHRADQLGTENAFVVLSEVNELLRLGRPVISFCIGQPDFRTPDHVCEAAIGAIREGRHCARAVDEFLMGSTTLPR